jgi:5'-nucleotidase
LPSSAQLKEAVPLERSAALVLLSNDDGFASLGLQAMCDALSPHAEVIVVAPETEQSAASHSLSLHRPLRLRKAGPSVFALDGTPADCVYVALYGGTRLLHRQPDLVVSGINRGMNLGQDVFYSGTIAAAREGALRGIPALAVSAHPSLDVSVIAPMCARIALALLGLQGADAPAPLVSLNIPPAWTGEVRATRLGQRIYDEIVDVRVDPRGREYIWIGGPGVRHVRDPGTDTDAYDDGAASLTPLTLDLTCVSNSGLASDLARAAVRDRGRPLHRV